MPSEEVLAVTLAVAEALEALGVTYVVGGSLASSLHGIPRATQDADLVADLREEHAPALADALRTDFYVDAEAITAAVRRGSCFNVIHLATMFKVDVFAPGEAPLVRDELARRQTFPLPGMPGRSIAVASPEDVILQKLLWYRKGDETSERQWRDVLGVIKVQGSKLDQEYLAAKAKEAGLEDLLSRARSQAETGEK